MAPQGSKSAQGSAEERRAAEEKSRQAEKVETPQETYWWVRFSEKGAKHEPEMIRLWVNGVGRQFARGIPTIAPLDFLKTADLAVEDKFSQVPGEPYKRLNPVNKANYNILVQMGDKGQATYEEYRKMLAEGTKVTQAEYNGKQIKR